MVKLTVIHELHIFLNILHGNKSTLKL